MKFPINYRYRLLLGTMLLVHVALLTWNACWMSPTLDEPAHIVAGLSHWQKGDFTLYRVNPPLVRLVATAPLVFAGCEFDFPEVLNDQFSRNEFWLGEQFISQNGRSALWLVMTARLACIPFSILAALTCYWWGKELFGRSSGILSCSLWCFSPMVLGHASLLTPDAPAAALGILACFTFWQWLKQPTWRRTIFAGLILGLAELCKTTLIVLYPLWPILWIIYRWQERQRMTNKQWWNESIMLVSRMLIGIYIINLGYLGQGSFKPLKSFVFSSELFGAVSNESKAGNHFKGSFLGELPMPLPYDYVLGIDHQQRDFEKFWAPSYLFGRYQNKGWWHYYACSLFVKAPVGTMGLVLLVFFYRLRRICFCPGFRDELVLLSPLVVVFFVVSSKTGFSHHLRYVFPCIPLAFVWVGQIWGVLEQETINLASNQESYVKRIRSIVTTLFVTGCIMWTFSSSLWYFPHSLSYFNALAGGPNNGPEYLLNSNVDWGQDLLHLERWMINRPDSVQVYLAFDNSYNPFVLKIPRIAAWPLKRTSHEGESKNTSLEQIVPEGYYAISVNQLYEFPWPLRDHDGSRYYLDTRPLKSLRSMVPIGLAGYSIRIYSATQLRAAYRDTER